MEQLSREVQRAIAEKKIRITQCENGVVLTDEIVRGEPS
jgi:hypothetical protein